MASEKPDLSKSLEQRLNRWRKDHLEGNTRVIITFDGPRITDRESVSLNEFGNTRLSFQHAANQLEDLLLAYFRMGLENEVKAVGQLPMPADKACLEYESRVKRSFHHFQEQFRGSITDLRFSMNDLWDEYERQFTEGEIEALEKRFDDFAQRLLDQGQSMFRTAAWSRPQGQQTATSSEKERAGARHAFVRPILGEKGWSDTEFATEAHIDKNTVRDYLNGVTEKPRRDALKKMAEALNVPVSDMPQ